MTSSQNRNESNNLVSPRKCLATTGYGTFVGEQLGNCCFGAVALSFFRNTSELFRGNCVALFIFPPNPPQSVLRSLLSSHDAFNMVSISEGEGNGFTIVLTYDIYVSNVDPTAREAGDECILNERPRKTTSKQKRPHRPFSTSNPCKDGRIVCIRQRG